MEIQKKAVT